MNIDTIYCIGTRWDEISGWFRKRIELIELAAFSAPSRDSLRKILRAENVNLITDYRKKLDLVAGLEMTYFEDDNIDLMIWLSDVQIRKQNDAIGIPLLLIVENEDDSFVYPTPENLENNLLLISKIGFPFDFIILRIAYGTKLSKRPNIKFYDKREFQLEEEIIKKSIEFTPEYYSAGLGILNFFGTYLRKRYPDEKATVKIEQEGLKVRLIVTTLDGKKEIIEKALQEYTLIVSGGEIPKEVEENRMLVAELRSELRLFSHRVETQKEIISYQQEDNHALKQDIQELKNLLKMALSQNQSIQINVTPTAISTANTSINFDIAFNISQALSSISDLMSQLAPNTRDNKDLQEVEKAITTIKNEIDPKVVKNSSAMSKLGDFLNKAIDGTDKTITAGEKAWTALKKLAGTYNSIAQWCGLPQVPTIFTK